MAKFKFEDPVLHELTGLGKCYHLQKLTVEDGQDVLITSGWFRADGIKHGFDKKPEISFHVNGMVREILSQIETEAVRQLKIPLELLQQHNISPDGHLYNVYRPLSSSQYLYGKLQRDCVIFNNRRQVIRKEDAGFGEYRVLLHVKGLYIGSHSQEGKLASLHMRIIQIQYREANFTCLLDPTPGLTRNPVLTVINTPVAKPVTAQTVPNAPKKTSRSRQNKPVLQRQNAMVDAQLSGKVTENIATDFFADIDI